MEFEDLNLGHKVLASPLKNIPITTVLYEISFFHQAS